MSLYTTSVHILNNSCNECPSAEATTSGDVTPCLLFHGAKQGEEAFPFKTLSIENLQTANKATMNFCFGCILSVILTLYLIPANAYKDDIPLQKWSPNYFSKRFFPQQKMDYKRRMPSQIQVTFQSFLLYQLHFSFSHLLKNLVWGDPGQGGMSGNWGQCIRG